jgi:hypothetical protein
MSEKSNINNSVYEFELALVNTKSGDKIYLPINKGAIDYLEIEDSLAFFGYNGVVRIHNFFGILQQLNVLDTDSINCMYIGINNADLNNIKKEQEPDSCMAFLALFDRGGESSVNNIEKTLNFRFEEYFVARLKHESIYQLGDKRNLTDTPGKLIHELLTASNKESVNEVINNTSDANSLFNLIDEVPSTLSLSNFYKPGTTSLYNIIVELYRYVSYTGSKKGPGILAASNTFKDNVIQRKFTLKSLADYILGFYLKYKQGTVEDLSEYVTEEFTVGSSASNTSLITNFLDTYDFINVDQDDVLSNKWVDYIIAEAGIDLANISTPSVLYDKVRHDFAIDMLAGLAPNLPDAPTTDTLNRKIVLKSVNENSNLTQTSIENALKKSFIFDNKALNFTVPGNIYRKAGKFIKVNDMGESGTLKSEKRRNIDGYWFITSVKHIFKGDYYTNEYTCVKLHKGDNKLLEPQRASTANNNPPTSLLQNTPQGLFRNNPAGTSTTAVPDNNGIINPPLESQAPPILNVIPIPSTPRKTTSEVFDTTVPLQPGIQINGIPVSSTAPRLPPPAGFSR